MKVHPYWLLVVSFVAILIVTMAACAPATAPEIPEPAGGDATTPESAAEPAAAASELVVAAGGMADTLDPQMSTSSLAMTTYVAVFDALTRIDEQGDVQSALAESWESIDPTTWEFQLRPDVEFHNGDVLTAEDVKFSLDRVLNPETQSPIRGRIASVESVEVIDDGTVRLQTSEPDPILLRRLAAVFIVPAEYFQEVGGQEFNEKPVGTGPFTVTVFVKGDHIVLEAFPNSWRATPNLGRVTIRVLPESSVRVAALQTGEVDVVQNLPVDQAKPLSDAGFQISYAPQARCMVISTNNTRDTPLQHTEVRQALSYAIDIQAIIDNIMQGYASPCKGQFVGEDGFGHTPDLEDYPYDVERAQELLAEAGYADGFEIGMTGTEGFYVNDRDWEVAIIGYLEEIGVDVDFRVVENAVYVPMIYDRQHAPLFPVAPNYFPAMDADFALNWFDSENPVKLYENPEFDTAFRESKRTMDIEERLDLLQEAATVLHDDPAAIFLFRPPELLAVNSQVQGIEARSDLVLLFDDVSVAQ